MRQVHAVVFSKALYGSDGYSNVFLVPSAWLYHSTRFESIERYTLGVVPVFFSDFDKAMHYLSDYLRMQRVKNENYRDLAIVTCSLSPKGEIESILKMSEPKKVKYKKLDKQEMIQIFLKDKFDNEIYRTSQAINKLNLQFKSSAVYLNELKTNRLLARL